jgi:hypothetical protein
VKIPRGDLAYAAALVDTLAVLKVRVIDSAELPVIALTTARHEAAVRFLAKLTGTKLTPLVKDYTHRGCNEHCPDKHKHMQSEGARWQVTGVKATIVLANLAPYMRAQRREAMRLIEIGRTVGYKGQVVNDMAQRGWKIPELKPQPRARVAVMRDGHQDAGGAPT